MNSAITTLDIFTIIQFTINNLDDRDAHLLGIVRNLFFGMALRLKKHNVQYNIDLDSRDLEVAKNLMFI